jgi:hypothetical protein
VSAHSASGLMLLRAVARRPTEYGLDYRYASLTNIVEFAVDNPALVADAETMAEGKIKRSLERARPGRSEAELIDRRIRRQLLKVKQALAWTELNHQMGVKSRHWNADRYGRLAKRLSVLVVLWRYRRRRFPKARPYATTAAAVRLAQLWELKQRGWKVLRDHMDQSGLDWRVGITKHLEQSKESLRLPRGITDKRVCCDQDGNTWMIKYQEESLLNPVLASLFARLSGCPGAEICPSFLDYDREVKQPCSVQPYVSARPVTRFDRLWVSRLLPLIDGDRRRASQMLCQTVAQWILDNIDANQNIIDEFGNCVLVDHDRSFFIDDRYVTTDWRSVWAARNKVPGSVVCAEVIKATAQVPGVLEDLAAFVARVEAIPAEVYEGIVRNASFREGQLCSLFYLDAMAPNALASINALERWIAHLNDRKSTVRAALARRLKLVLGTVELPTMNLGDRPP